MLYFKCYCYATSESDAVVLQKSGTHKCQTLSCFCKTKLVVLSCTSEVAPRKILKRKPVLFLPLTFSLQGIFFSYSIFSNNHRQKFPVVFSSRCVFTNWVKKILFINLFFFIFWDHFICVNAANAWNLPPQFFLPFKKLFLFSLKKNN